MAGGERGVGHLTALLYEDYVRTLKLLGVSKTAELERDLVSFESHPLTIPTGTQP